MIFIILYFWLWLRKGNLFVKEKKTSFTDSNINNWSSSQKRNFKNSIRKKNPDLFHFIQNNSFIYEPLYSSYFYEKLNDKNSMKLNKSKLVFLYNLINSFQSIRPKSYIYVLTFFKELIKCNVPCEPYFSERVSIVKNIINNSQTSSQVSINKITEKYKEFPLANNKTILHKTSIYNIITKELHYTYRKTTIKTNKLITYEYNKYSFFL